MVTIEKVEAGAAAARAMPRLPRRIKDDALRLLALRLRERAPELFEANEADVAAARASGASEAILTRLVYDGKKLEESIAMIDAVSRLPDPSGRTLESRRLDDGLVLRRVSCPIGLIALIFESRPDALVQMAALAVKSGDAIIVKGGREAERTNRALAAIVAAAGVDGPALGLASPAGDTKRGRPAPGLGRSRRPGHTPRLQRVRQAYHGDE